MPHRERPPKLELKGTQELLEGFDQKRAKFPKDRFLEIGTEESLECPFMSRSLSPPSLPEALAEHGVCAQPRAGAGTRT